MYKLTFNPDEVRIPSENKTITRASRFWPDYEKWLAEGNPPEPEFTLVELKAKYKSELDGEARRKHRERIFQESTEKAACVVAATKMESAKDEAAAEREFATAMEALK